MRYGVLRMLSGTLLAALACAPAAWAQSEIPAGTRFLVELRDNLEARKLKPGKKFDARTLEALRATDGSVIEAGARLKGRVASVDERYVVLRFEEIDTGRGKAPLVATVRSVASEKGIRKKAGDEGEIRSSSSRGRNAAIGAAVGAGLGMVIGATQGGSRAAVLGAVAGAAAGGLLGASTGSRELVLREGARIELQLDRPLVFKPRR